MKTGLLRHARFLVAVAVGSALFLLSNFADLAWQMQALIGVNGFFLAYLGLMASLAAVTTPSDLRRQAEVDDEGIVLIVLLAIGAVMVSLVGIVWVLHGQDTRMWQAVCGLSAVPLGWATVHTLAGFRYAHLYYSSNAGSGLMFPGTDKPDAWDFLYFSFGIGMTAQVSDVTVSDPVIRKTVLGHAIGAFFYNAVILALAVNAGLVLGT